jgi:hypothetical protein
MVLSTKTIAIQYFKSWFLLDLLSSIPVALISLFHRSASELGRFKGLRVLKVSRLSRLYDHKWFKSLERKGDIPPSLLRLVQFLFVYLYSLHIITCFFWLVLTNTSDGESSSPDSDSWSGISLEGADRGANLGTRYMLGMYWSMVVSLGNDFKPDNISQKMFSSAILMAGQINLAFL